MQNLAAYSEMTIKQGSKSFAKAAMLFDSETRQSVTMLYAWCRYCDDVIDGQTLGHGMQTLSLAQKVERLQLLQQETGRIVEGHSSDIPAFAALGQVVRRHGIARRHLFELLEGFALDATEARFVTLNDTLHYCYHVAGVVGVMMAQIMGVKDQETMHRATDLGIAFQLTNIARDVVDDMRVGRCYLPEEWLHKSSIPRDGIHLPQHRAGLHTLACELVELAEQYYASARIGISRLPWRCAWAIAGALLIYRDIGLQVRSADASAWDRRSQVSGRQKIWRLCQGAFIAVNAVSRKGRIGFTPRAGLWTKTGS
ncbi:MAG: phytoene/squalene synthase family protein [Bdellovibrionales bacterium]|nr:phytoene/squalene synthase family protein [Massilia sp.]